MNILSVSMQRLFLSEQDFDVIISWKIIFLFFCVFFILLLSPYCIAIFFLGLAIYSLFGRKHALESMAISVVIKYANPGLVAFPAAFGLYSWIFLFVASFSLLLRSKFKNNALIISLTIFYVVVVCISFWSAYPAVSMLKVTSFYIVVVSVLSGALSMDESEFVALSRTFFSMLVAIITLSLPLYYIPNIGFMRNGHGFQGILNHPQAFGTLFSPLCAWLVVRLGLIKNVQSLKKYIILFIITVVCMLISGSRTSIVSTAMAIFLCFPVFFRARSKNFGVSMRKAAGSFFVVLGFLIVTFSISETFSDFLSGFITKGQSDATISEAFQHSRGRGVEGHLANFMKSPWIGNGFGVGFSADFGAKITYLMGIPVSAASEKGIVYTAILEEIGIIGLIPFLFFLGTLFIRAIRLAPSFMAMLFSCLTVNIGEAVLFSVNGNGLVYWVIIGLCLGSSAHSSLAQPIVRLV